MDTQQYLRESSYLAYEKQVMRDQELAEARLEESQNQEPKAA